MISGRQTVRELADLIAERGRPKMIVSDNGTELTSNAVLAWSADYNTERPRSSLGYATPAAFAAGLERQRSGVDPDRCSPARLHDNTGQSLVAPG